jgi:hypothetical protein
LLFNGAKNMGERKARRAATESTWLELEKCYYYYSNFLLRFSGVKYTVFT